MIGNRKKKHFDLWTEAGERDSSGRGWQQYPRPQLKRDGYLILNEGWKLNGQSVKVPFPPQSMLSDYHGKIDSQINRNQNLKDLNYETEISIPQSFAKERILLHFGAVDQIAEVWVNDVYAGRHEGGYLPFTLDITKLADRNRKNRLVVKAKDTLSKDYPYGKQCKKRGGMWYTPISGIWQNVWLENVPEQYIENIVLKPDLEGIHICLITDDGLKAAPQQAQESGFSGSVQVAITLHNGEVFRQEFTATEGYIRLTDYSCADGAAYKPRYWTPEQPYLYSMKIKAGNDEVETYFALRTIDIRQIDGIRRVCLNGKPIFLHGILDQGYFSDGIYLPAEPEEYERDILRMKELGFNMLRKHIKIEPECFYYYCDKHGMLVMQDMVNNGKYSFLWDTALPTIGMKKRKDTGGIQTKRQAKRKVIFKQHTEATIRQLYNHPCIVAYTIFNEGWGQFDSDEMYDFVRNLDDCRLIDTSSGWFWQQKSDFDSEHIYFKTIDLKVGERPLLVSECGGYSRVVEKHHYSPKSYGYGSAENEAELTAKITDMYEKMILPGIPKGVCGCVYTQLSDVEDEVNGLYTYDRRVCKVNKKAMQQLSDRLKLQG